MKTGDTITVIHAPGKTLAKTVQVDGKTIDYDNVWRINLFEVRVPDLDSLRDLLTVLATKADRAAVFGGIADPHRRFNVRRLAYRDPESGDEPTLRPVAHRWCALDVDGVGRPEGVPADDLAACAALAVQHLPAAFQGVRCIVQATAGHGLKPGCRLRLWYWLSRLTTGDELKFWLRDCPVDPCTFRAAQPIYTAEPVFKGRADHLPCRIAEVPGKPCVMVPRPGALKPPPRPTPPPRTELASKDETNTFIERVLARVHAADDGEKHDVLRSCARLLGGAADQAGFTENEMVGWLLAELPETAKDLHAAERTIRWAFNVGRASPIVVDERRSETINAAFRLLRRGTPSADLLAELRRQNRARAEPLPEKFINDTALDCARRMTEKTNAQTRR